MARVWYRYLEGHCCSDHEEEEDAQGPDVDRGTQIRVVTEEFRRCVRRRSAKGCQHLIVYLLARRETEIPQYNAIS